MKIGNRQVGPLHPPLIVAELGINHGGDLDVAKMMVDAARSVGCEAIKHQTHIVEDEMTFEAKKVFPPNANESIWDVIERNALTLQEEEELKVYVEDRGMIFFSTPFSRAAANFLNNIGVPAFKIGSGECDNLPLIQHIASFGKPIILSTGMQSIESVRRAVQLIERCNVSYALLECTNLYPSPPQTVSLRGILQLQTAFPNAIVGFSDHSIGCDMSIAAIALGASIVERHFTDSHYRSGPDISSSLDPGQLRHLIEVGRDIFVARNNEKRRTPEEEPVYRFARSSVVADKDLAAGTIISENDIWVRRPGTGEIAGSSYWDLIGKRLLKDLPKNSQLRWSDFVD